MKTYFIAAISMKFRVRHFKHISRYWLRQLAARRDESSSRLSIEKNVSTCQRWP
jgi:hypothetical protein